MVLRRVGVMSAGKLMGTLGVLLGLLFGGFFALVSLVGGTVQIASGNGNGPPFPDAFLGVGAIVILPLFYGVTMFLGGLIYAWFYNIVAGMVGGLELDFEPAAPTL